MRILYCSLSSVLLACLLFSALSITPAHAYIDPGTGSYAFQLLVAAIVGGLFAVKGYWQRIVGLFTHKQKEKE